MTGSILLTLAFLVSLTAFILYSFSLRHGNNFVKYAGQAYTAGAFLVICASSVFLYAILTHDYQYKYVYQYSSNGLSSGLLLSSVYAGQEGSLLLWILFISIGGIFLRLYLKNNNAPEAAVMAVYSFVLTALLVLVSPFMKNPFASMVSAEPYVPLSYISSRFGSPGLLKDFLYSDNNSGEHFVKITSALYNQLKSSGIDISGFIIQGRGLNPVLQNFWMQVHPPVLFIGFALSLVPYSFALGSLICKEFRNWADLAFPWILAGNMMLGAALMLGGYWAYGVLGWGGYWSWDPVENSSLVPWLLGAALIHTILLQKKEVNCGGEHSWQKTNLILSMSVFWLVLYSSFLTRSGILGNSSVHSFTDPGSSVYLFLILILFLSILSGVYLLWLRWRDLNSDREEKSAIKKAFSFESLMLLGALFIIAISVVVLCGTSAPLAGFSIESSYYGSISVPLAFIMLLLNGFSVILLWNKNRGLFMLKGLILQFLTALVFSGIYIWTAGIENVPLIVFVFSAVFSLVTNLWYCVKLISKKAVYSGSHISHIGIALLVMGIAATSGFEENAIVELRLNRPQNVLGYKMTYRGIKHRGAKYGFLINLEKGGSLSQIIPVMYISKYNNNLMREPDFLSTFTHDLYVSPLAYEEAGSGTGKIKEPVLTVESAIKPYVIFVWMGSLTTFAGFVISLIRRLRRREAGQPDM